MNNDVPKLEVFTSISLPRTISDVLIRISPFSDKKIPTSRALSVRNADVKRLPRNHILNNRFQVLFGVSRAICCKPFEMRTSLVCSAKTSKEQ